MGILTSRERVSTAVWQSYSEKTRWVLLKDAMNRFEKNILRQHSI